MNDLYTKFKFPKPPKEEEFTWPGKRKSQDKPAQADQPEYEIPPYIFNDEIKTIIKVALVTERPLLITGNPGSGKTSLARSIASYQDWNYLKYTFTSRSRLEELTGEIDQLQRLHDAHRPHKDNALKDDWAYYKPGVFWWAFDPDSAKQKGNDQELPSRLKSQEPDNFDPKRTGSVVLLDEIDKAEPDLPNDLLEPLDRMSFQLPGIKPVTVSNLPPLVIITSNGERDLPDAFLRRCILLDLPDPDADMLVNIAEHHFRKTNKEVSGLFMALANKFLAISKEAFDLGNRQPGASEYLDTVKACLKLGITPDRDEDSSKNTTWQQIERATLRKTKRPESRHDEEDED